MAQPTRQYGVTLRYVGPGGADVPFVFKSRGVYTSTLTADARKAAVKAGHKHDLFTVLSSTIQEVPA